MQLLTEERPLSAVAVDSYALGQSPNGITALLGRSVLKGKKKMQNTRIPLVNLKRRNLPARQKWTLTVGTVCFPCPVAAAGSDGVTSKSARL